MWKKIALCFFVLVEISCGNKHTYRNIPRIGFLDFLEDPTIALARKGFEGALKEKGFSEEDSTLEIIYSNAQGDIPSLGQACDFILSKKVALIATNVTLSTITAVQRTETVPIFMMVSPRPDLAGLADKKGKYPANVFGTYETLDYIDTAITIIRELKPGTKKIGTVFNQAEPQSRMAFVKLKSQSEKLGMTVESLPVNNSSETQLVTQALLNKGIDVFFALPDNVIFASFETLVESCNNAKVPVFTCEAGLVSRGAVASFGADFYQWGYQTGLQAAQFLLSKSYDGMKPEIVKVRKRIYNPDACSRFNIQPNNAFSSYK